MKVFLIVAAVALSLPGYAQYKFENAVYKDNIRSVRLHADGDYQYLSSVASLEQQNLVLEFDALSSQKAYYFVKLINATQEWKKSPLANLDFLSVYNEFSIDDYQYSNNHSAPYIHYKIVLPKVKVPGNYLILTYQDSEGNPVLTQRMMVYDHQLGFSRNHEFNGLGNLETAHQSFNFFVSYNSDIINPSQNITVIMRQNQRWDNARTLTPFSTREDVRRLEYRQTDVKDQFLGGNEFRFIDFRSLYSPGQNIARIDMNKKPIEVTVNADKPRGDEAYAQYLDMNGNYYTQADPSGTDPSGNGENYVNVNFKLASPPLKSDVYVMGAFNNWTKTEENKMIYDAASGSYGAVLFLKQGFYNYLYWSDDKTNGFEIEGSHFETENGYEALIYYRSLQPRTDLLLGYFSTVVNPRQR